VGGGIDWIGLAQNWDKWRALVNAVINLRILHWLHNGWPLSSAQLL
jgi:hypothetical protein